MSTARTASPRTARAINDRIALELLVERGPLTATRLRELTGLSRPSVSDLLDRLGRSGLVEVVGEAGEERRGPNAKVYGLVGERAHVAALDVRTGGVAFTFADLTGATVGRGAVPVDGGADAVGSVLLALDDARREAGVPAFHTAVMGAPGLADPRTGALPPFGGLPDWHGELLAALREGMAAPVLLENEVNLAGIAEHRVGAVRDRDTFVLIWLGHGIGAAVVLDGALRRGASGGAGELGFLPVPGTGGLPSATDCDGGFHTQASSGAVCALARRHGLPAGAGDDAAAAEAVVRAAAEENAGAGAAFLDELAARVAVAIAGVAAVLDPGCVVLGGEVGRAGGAALAERVAARVRPLSPLATEVRASTVTGSPVLNGALLTALDAAREALFTSTV
ncbi:ROK family transcriptional regulator [Streptomyces radicis]|uniref:ROK family transcriptional regulator n=1 Tax=Streptomyces radicis TaxID=1750517 RepID=A0A3A9WI31_9ACTN|nr:ROK family transcriptional regulator [Streptomyces radicis]RKN12625.1 ROK family transcriptional regulator [Streptomyces radicis]RKN27611.1 ROK family transcriptional regulator [Streptomyces radicis]